VFGMVCLLYAHGGLSVPAFRPQHVPDIETRDVTRRGPGCGGSDNGRHEL